MTIVQEGKAVISVPKTDKLTKKSPAFYNPVMKHNRDITILLLKAIPQNKLRIGLPLAGTGVRGIRMLKELPSSKVSHVHFNDRSPSAIRNLKSNLKRNRVSGKFTVISKDADLFLLGSEGFDYIDIDPFGSPNAFIDSAVKRLSRNGILAVTATDTSALCGSFRSACIRKYWAVPLHTDQMHEFGLRILIRKVQLVASQYGKALAPIYSYSRDHYMRVFFRMVKGKQHVDKLLKYHQFYENAGPTWMGQLWDTRLASRIARMCTDDGLKGFLSTISDESRIPVVGYQDIHSASKKDRRTAPRNQDVLKGLKHDGHRAAFTHFSPQGIRTTAGEKEFSRILRRLSR
jgi:tRNA (guanine26-N2/guanine27-N2)-dimethyltransferase